MYFNIGGGSKLPGSSIDTTVNRLARYNIDYVSNMTVSYKRQELLAHRGRLGSPPGLVGSVLLIFLVFCVVLLYCLSSSCVLCAHCCKFVVVVHF